MKIKNFTGEITQVIDLSETAKEVYLTLSEPLDFPAGSFVNVFMDIDGKKVRRAYSISSSENNKDKISLTLRLTPTGVMTPLFWRDNLVGQSVELMGPLGLNTVDKMNSNKVFLFAFGVGAGVVKSIADHFSRKDLESLTIITGSKHEKDILYKDYFDRLSDDFKNISVKHVVSRGDFEPTLSRGYIQDFIGDFDFNNSDVYVCGQEKACEDLVEKVKTKEPINCNFFVEGFH